MASRVFTRLVAASLVFGLLASGCAILGVRKQREELQALVRIRGEVRLDVPSDKPIVVVLGRQADDPTRLNEDGERASDVIDHFPLERPGKFAFAVSPGTFRLAAFEDRNSNLTYDPGESVLVPQPFFDLGAGADADGIELVIPRAATLDRTVDILALQARTPKNQENFSLGRFTVHGEVVDLDDPKFGAESGKMGMWRFVDFLFEIGPGVYFLEPYDPNKIPVLFVHGISGYPQQFSTLIGKLDRKRFQPWFYFYPSGIHLDALSSHLTEIVAGLQVKLGFDEMAVVAHSMGGLVARSFILKHWEQTGRRDIKVFVAISTPWGGSEGASDVGDAPQDLVVYSWLDMNPESDFLKGLFYQAPDYRQARPLPSHVQFDMMYGFNRDEHSLGPSGDTVLTLRSMTRIEAIEAANYRALPLDATHVDILKSDEAVKRLNAILEEVFQ